MRSGHGVGRNAACVIVYVGRNDSWTDYGKY